MSEEYSWSESFQRKLLALYVRIPNKTFSIIEPSYFTSPVHSEIAKVASSVYNGHNKAEVRISKPTLISLVRGYLGKKRAEVWPGYRKEIRDIYEDELKDKDVILGQALAFAKEQKFRETLVQAEKDINAKQFDRAIARFDKMKGFGEDRDVGLEFWRNVKTSKRWLEDRMGLVGTFYFKKLDKMMGGGLGGGELGIVLAGGKVGKSTILARFAAGAMWQGKNAAIATGELSDKKYRKRIDSMFTVIPGWKLTKYSKGFMEDNKKLTRSLEKAQRRLELTKKQAKGSLWIKQWPTNKGKVSDIENWLDALKENGVEIDILFVDYVRVFRPSEKFDEQRLSIGAVCMDLRGIAVARNIPVWTAAQTNRAALSKASIGAEDMAEDISQFWTLDFLVALCQTENESLKDPERARLFLTAARDAGRGGIVNIKLKRDIFRVWEQEDGRHRS